MSPNPQETADFVTFTEEILNGKLIGVFEIKRFNQNVQINTNSHISYAVYYL